MVWRSPWPEAVEIAGILALATNEKAPLDESGAFQVTKLVAGAGFEPATFRL